MKYKLRDSFIQRMVQAKKWENLFLVVGTLTVVVILHQQDVPYALQITLLISGLVFGYLWNSYQALKRTIASAQEVSLALGEKEVIYNHINGENRINYSSIQKLEMKKQEWPELLITMKDKQRLKIQGFENIEGIAEYLRGKIK